MLTTSLPLLPPPASSLLPSLHDHRNLESSNVNHGQHSLQSQQQQQQQRRARGHPHAAHPRSHLALLAYDERLIAQRKLAIQMYGYSWLKPAGCSKTMLGRREEEIEREEVEKQLRDAELQERNQAEMEEAQRQGQLEEQRGREAAGEDVGEEGERDLDEDVPDADATEGYDEDGSEEDDDDDVAEDEIVDLDDEIPEADNSWAYETRTSDTQSEPPSSAFASQRIRSGHTLHSPQGLGRRSHGDPVRPSQDQEYFDDEPDLDDEIPDMDGDAQDLDDDIPDAEEDEGWEHTDTELDESEMDISIMPPGVVASRAMPPPASTRSQQAHRHNPRHSAASEMSDAGPSMRRTSGNVPLPAQPSRFAVSGRGINLADQLTPNFAPGQLGSDFSVSALISTGNTDMSSDMIPPAQRGRLNPASARRNLFGVARNEPAPFPRQTNQQDGARLTRNQPQNTTSNITRQVSSGGLFTPSPQQQNTQRQPNNAFDEPQSRTRSGRVIGRARGGRA